MARLHACLLLICGLLAVGCDGKILSSPSKAKLSTVDNFKQNLSKFLKQKSSKVARGRKLSQCDDKSMMMICTGEGSIETVKTNVYTNNDCSGDPKKSYKGLGPWSSDEHGDDHDDHDDQDDQDDQDDHDDHDDHVDNDEGHGSDEEDELHEEIMDWLTVATTCTKIVHEDDGVHEDEYIVATCTGGKIGVRMFHTPNCSGVPEETFGTMPEGIPHEGEEEEEDHDDPFACSCADEITAQDLAMSCVEFDKCKLDHAPHTCPEINGLFKDKCAEACTAEDIKAIGKSFAASPNKDEVEMSECSVFSSASTTTGLAAAAFMAMGVLLLA